MFFILCGHIQLIQYPYVKQNTYIEILLLHSTSFQIIYQTKKHGYVTLYITGRDKEECEDWVISIRQGNTCSYTNC